VLVPEDTLASNSGSFYDYDDMLTITASQGERRTTATAAGAGRSLGQRGKPDHSRVIITASRADGASASARPSDVTFSEVPPTVDYSGKLVGDDTGRPVGQQQRPLPGFRRRVTITASQGTVSDNGDGHWSWSQQGDESDSGRVTITATSGARPAGQAAWFDVTFSDVAGPDRPCRWPARRWTTPENLPASNRAVSTITMTG